MSSRERERERERERDACDVIDITFISWSCILIASTSRRRVVFWIWVGGSGIKKKHYPLIWAWPADLHVVKCSSAALVGARKRTVEDWFTQACKDKELGPWAAGSRDWWMTMEKSKLCVRWSACRWSPSSMLQARRTAGPSWCLFSFQMATVLPLRTTWIADSFRKRPCAMYKDNAVGNVIAETDRDCVTTARRTDLSMPFPLCASSLKGEVRRSPWPSARPSMAADS